VCGLFRGLWIIIKRQKREIDVMGKMGGVIEGGNGWYKQKADTFFSKISTSL
jgi:hypothetical protein